MKFTTALLAGAAVLAGVASAGPTVQYSSGFNLGATKHTLDETNGQCKTAEDWRKEFAEIKAWGSKNPTVPKAQFSAVKIFSTSDCNALALAVPEAIAAGIKIWVGVWNVPEEKFNMDKGALEAAIRNYGTDWIAGINVGSESLYRKEIQPWRLAEQIWDVKGMVQIALNAPHVAVGTADTWTSWENGNDNHAVFDAVDVITMNGFPYWEGKTPAEGLASFQEAIRKSRTNAGWDKPFVIGETGWPTIGDNFGVAVPSVPNLQEYWKSVGCWLLQNDFAWFWFSGYDEPARGAAGVEGNFGITQWNGTPKVDFDMKTVCGF